ncbi:Bdr family repetitive protein [Borreliella americana]|uniref:Bdr family repetitive protein n=1 Tax=Borreliella americana TaxID=478807 RepID=UPI001E5520DA|nr:Bdr family repetitive protein [Borreliella americana]MCD2349903.1 Bdr family repetitive protein [Borreliella americana]MCD2382399.1 Bdr family repetitive protein [Borreliella americana]
METVSTNIAGVTQEQIYKEFIRLGMEQLIAQDLSKRYYYNELTYRDLENLEKQFNIKFDNLVSKIDNVKSELNTKIDNVEKNLQKDISNLDIKIDNVEKHLQKDISNLDIKIDNVEKNLNAKIDSVEKNLIYLAEMLKWVLGITGAMSITMIAGLIFAFISK